MLPTRARWLWCAAVACVVVARCTASQPRIDAQTAAQWLFPLAADGVRAAVYDAAARRALKRQACGRHGHNDVLVLDAGSGALTRTVTNVARSMPSRAGVAVAGLAPAHAPALVSVMQASVDGLSAPVAVFPTPRHLQAAGGVSACAVVVDWVPKDPHLTAALLWTLARVTELGWVAPGARVVPPVVTVWAAVLASPDVAAQVTVDPTATQGVNLTAAFAPHTTPDTAAWTASGKQTARRHVAHQLLTPPDAVSWRLRLQDVAAAAVASRLPMVLGASVAATVAGQADAVNVWQDVVMRRDAVVRGCSPFSGTTHAHEPHFDDTVVPVAPAPMPVAVGDRLSLQLVVGTDYTLSVRLVTAPPQAPAPPQPPAADFPLWHVSMVNDHARNAAYATAIRRAVAHHVRLHDGVPAVLDVGAGAGLLSLLAAAAGAAPVYSVEGDDAMVSRLRAAVAANDAAHSVLVLHSHSSQLHVAGDAAAAAVSAAGDTATAADSTPPTLPFRADIVVHEVFDGSVTGEGVVPSLNDAVGRLTVPSPVILPASATIHAMVVHSPPLARLFRLSPAAARAAPGLTTLQLHGLQHGVALNHVAYTALTPVIRLATLTFPVTDWAAALAPAWSGTALADGDADAVVSWFSLGFGRAGVDVSYSSAPWAMPSASHWTQMVQMLPADAVRRCTRDATTLVLTPMTVDGAAGGFTGVRAEVTVSV